MKKGDRVVAFAYLLFPDYHYLTATVKLSPILQDIEV